MNDAPVPKEAVLEGLKLYYDVFKHLTTLSSGSIVVIVAFRDALGDDSESTFLMGIALVGFLLAAGASIVVMLATARAIRQNELLDELPYFSGSLGYICAVAGFAVGVVSVSLFGWLNLR